MNHSKNLINITALAAGMLLLNSCKKEEIKPKTDQSVVSSKIINVAAKNIETYNIVQSIMVGVVQYGSQHFKTEGDGFLSGFSCATVTKDTVSVPHTATVDFGSGCTNASGKFMSGSLTVEYLDKDFKAPGNYYRATFTNFVSAGRTVSGTLQLTYTGAHLSGNESASIESNLSTNYFKDNLQFSGRNHFSIEYSPDSVSDADAITSYTGSGDGVTSDSLAYTQTITTPLVMKTACYGNFVSGILHTESPGLPNQDVDYGDGTCDKVATVYQNGSSYNISLD